MSVRLGHVRATRNTPEISQVPNSISALLSFLTQTVSDVCAYADTLTITFYIPTVLKNAAGPKMVRAK